MNELAIVQNLMDRFENILTVRGERFNRLVKFNLNLRILIALFSLHGNREGNKDTDPKETVDLFNDFIANIGTEFSLALGMTGTAEDMKEVLESLNLATQIFEDTYKHTQQFDPNL
jgi:hypothetical protein